MTTDLESPIPYICTYQQSKSVTEHLQLYARGGHFLQGNAAAFDAPFFTMTAKEAAALDPGQRLALEVAYHAFENGMGQLLHPLIMGTSY